MRPSDARRPGSATPPPPAIAVGSPIPSPASPYYATTPSTSPASYHSDARMPTPPAQHSSHTLKGNEGGNRSGTPAPASSTPTTGIAPRRRHNERGLSIEKPRTPNFLFLRGGGRGGPLARGVAALIAFIALSTTVCFVFVSSGGDVTPYLTYFTATDAKEAAVDARRSAAGRAGFAARLFEAAGGGIKAEEADGGGGNGLPNGGPALDTYDPLAAVPGVMDNARRPTGERFAQFNLPHMNGGFRSVRVYLTDPIDEEGGPLDGGGSSEMSSEQRAEAQAAMVKEAMRDAFGAYERYAWGKDELKPVSKSFHNWGTSRGGPQSLKGMALTAVDSLSTLWLMGLTEEFHKAMTLVTEEVDYSQDMSASVFEYTIRVVGGLLSAYELSGEQFPRLLATARRVMDKLLVAYNTPSGLPVQTVNLRSLEHYGPDWAHGAAILSELGTVQLELRTLSYHTKDPIYDIKATHITDLMEARCAHFGGLCPLFFNVTDAVPANRIFSYGSNSDSYYEYLLKQYILTGRTEERYKRLALEALDEGIAKLLSHSSANGYAYFDKRDEQYAQPTRDHRMDHLACFAGGMYAMAGQLFPDYGHAALYREVGRRVTHTCNYMYEMQETGLSPDFASFVRPLPDGRDMVHGRRHNLLRPEVVESLFYMWRYTKEQKYRDMAWEIFKSFRKYSRCPETGGYSGVKLNNFANVLEPVRDDMMQSFFLSETLKYLYLIFSEDSVLDLNEWVFNTEAHPLKIRHRDPMDIWRLWERTHGKPAFLNPTVLGVAQRTETAAMASARAALGGVVVAEKDPRRLLAEPFAPDDTPPVVIGGSE